MGKSRKPRAFRESPTEHGRRADRNRTIGLNFITRGSRLIAEGDCSSALQEIVYGVGKLAQAESDLADSAGTGKSLREANTRADQVLSEFRRNCVRKPGIIDRFRRKKG